LSDEDMPRGEFKAMLGMSDQGAAAALRALVKHGLPKSDSPQDKMRFGLPQHALRFMLPQLRPEAEADSANFLRPNWPLAQSQQALAAIKSAAKLAFAPAFEPYYGVIRRTQSGE
jgi:hypothetical protein